jgi:hypothetical protein
MSGPDMTENLEPAADAAARATRRMMEATGLQGHEGVALNPEATAAMLAAHNIMLLTLFSFLIEAGLKVDAIPHRLQQIASSLPSGHSARVLKHLDNMTAWLCRNAPDHLKE